tara:strand:- start:310 stop:984 length:675 start_codon:yes stop_codon:yes gene_type:complete
MSSHKKSLHPFQFATRLHLPQLTGISIHNLRELLEALRSVPGSVIYHHTHHFLQQHQNLIPGMPNDFAYWVQEALGENRLAEQLASLNANEFSTVREIREAMIGILEGYLNQNVSLREALPGEELPLIRSISFILATPYAAHDLLEFAQILEKITIDSLYFHIFEARLRLHRPTNDFSIWLDEDLGEPELSKTIARLDPYTHTMEGLRKQIVTLVKKQIHEESA